MGKPTGFLEYRRVAQAYDPVPERIRHYKEFVHRLSESEAAIQGARCMDCGIPFCHNGCPVNNLIPDWNDLVYRKRWREGWKALDATNNFPEFTGRVCPAPCEAACTLNINDEAIGIKSIEHFLADLAWERGWVLPHPPKRKTGRKVAVVGSGPAGLAAAQQLARAGHEVTLFEKNDRIGGLLRYGIPDFKLEKWLIDRRLAQMEAEGVRFRTGVLVGAPETPAEIHNAAKSFVSAEELRREFDAVVLAAGSEVPRDLPVPGRELEGVYFALQFLIPQNREMAGDAPNPISAKGKHVVVIGGGDTGADCVGTAIRHGAQSVTQLELMPRPPEQEDKALTWPYWPNKLRTSTSHLEGEVKREFAVLTKAFLGDNGRVRALRLARLDWSGGQMKEIPGSECEIPADLVLLAMGFTHPLGALLEAFGVEKDARGNAAAPTEGPQAYATSVPGVFAAGDVRRGQSLIVWAIREGRQAARAVDLYLMGESVLLA